MSSKKFDEYNERTAELDKVIRPLRTARYEIDSNFNHVQTQLINFGKDYGGLNLTPDFQRGHVWTVEQKTHYIENILRGVISSAGFLLQFNCPNWDDDGSLGDLPRGFECIDGLQRLTAVQDFLAGGIDPFGLTLKDLNGSRY